MSSDISSRAASILPTASAPSAPLHFDAVIRTEYVESTEETHTGRKRQKRSKIQYTCTICPSWDSHHRTNAIKHVNSRHPVSISSAQSSRTTPASTRDISTIFTPISSRNGLRNGFNQHAYKEAIIGLLTRRRMPFSAVEWSEMKDLALACNPAIEDLLITSRRSAVRHIASNYRLYKEQIKNSLLTALSPIHFSSDLWTSPHRHALLAVCVQWVDKDYRLQKALLGLPECRHNHSGERQAGLIVQVLERFDIQSKLGWHTGDNATSNNTCLETLETELLLRHNVAFDASQRRIRCIAHIINLSLQAFLLASSREALRAALEATAEVSGEDLLTRFSEALTSQRSAEARRRTTGTQPKQSRRQSQRRGSHGSQGPIDDDCTGMENASTLRKLHGLAVWLRNSSIHANLWDDSVGLRLGIDNVTRWSSWFLVISRALKRKPRVVQFMTDHEVDLGDNRLTAQDWDFLVKAEGFLQPFAQGTLYAEGKSSISQSLYLMDALLSHYEKAKVG
jgi:hypothetical protein